ncbi:MAG: hypothetical protein ABSB69_11225 [Solirubrobacteraceae bacterium]
MENGIRGPKRVRGRAYTVCGDRLVETTPEVNREVAESAMLLSQGARRAIEMMHEAHEAGNEATTPAVPAPGAAAAEA